MTGPTKRRWTLLAFAAQVTLASGGLSGQVAAERLRGIATSEMGGTPIAGALITLLDDAGEKLDEVLSAQDGTFVLQAPKSGWYRLRLHRIGFRTWTSERRRFNDGAGVTRLVIPVSAVSLEEIRVEAASKCATTADEVTKAWDLYARAAPQLEDIALAESQARYLFQVELTEDIPGRVCGRKWASASDRLQPAPPRTVLLPTPVATLDPASLADRGYAAPDSTGALRFYAPTAETLLSEEFLDTHCLSTTSDVERGREGIVFTPVAERAVSDVEGVLWLNAQTDELEALDFQYTRVRKMLEEHQLPSLMDHVHRRLTRDPRVDNYIIQVGSIKFEAEFGGSLVFETLAEGTRITRSWELRVPGLGECTYLDWRRRPARLGGKLVAWARTRRGTVTAVLMRGDAAPARDTIRR